MRFAKWIELSGLKRIEVADRLGISSGHLTDLCNLRFWPNRRLAQKIYELTEGDVSPYDFLYDDPPPPPIDEV